MSRGSINFVFLLLLSCSTFAIDLSKYEDTCEDIGLKRKTQQFGECVLELRSRENTPPRSQATVPSTGDQSPDHMACARYGFILGTAEYAQCRMQIDMARRQAFEQQRQHEDQLAAQQKAKDRARGEVAFMLGLGMMSGQNPNFGFNNNALTPPSPTRIINLPGGRTMTCTTMGAFTNCN